MICCWSLHVCTNQYLWQQCTTIKLEITFDKNAANRLLSKVLVSKAWCWLGWARIKLLGHAGSAFMPDRVFLPITSPAFQLNDVVSNSSTPATVLSLTTEAEDFSMSQVVTYADLRELPTTRLALDMCLQQASPSSASSPPATILLRSNMSIVDPSSILEWFNVLRSFFKFLISFSDFCILSWVSETTQQFYRFYVAVVTIPTDCFYDLLTLHIQCRKQQRGRLVE